MATKHQTFIRGALSMTGTIIGAGVFALPYAFKSTGLISGSILYWFLALVVLATHLVYVEVVLSKGMKNTRLPGQVQKILGSWFGRLASVTHPLQAVGACLAYLILGGEFLSQIAGAFGLPDNILLWQILFWIGGAVTLLYGLRIVARVESVMTWALIVAMLFAVALYAGQADAANVQWSNWGHGFAPIGVFLFSLFGLPAIPEIAELCARDVQRTKRAVAVGTIVAALLMWLFGIAAYAAIGMALKNNPAALSSGLPSLVFCLIPTVGFLAVITSFITLMQDVRFMLQFDFKMSSEMAWAVSLAAPLALLLFVTRNFFATVGFVGSLFTSINALFVAVLSSKTSGRILLPGVIATVFLSVLFWRILFPSL